MPATAETAARTSADTACCFGAGAWPKDLMLSLVMVAVSLGESRRAVGNSDCREGGAIGDDATVAAAVDTNGVPDARRCTPVVGGEVDRLELAVPELDKLFCRLSPLTLADTDEPLLSEGACALGVSGISSESWSSFGDGSSTLVGGDTGAAGAAALAVSGAVGVVALGITGEAGEVVGAWVRALGAGSGEFKRGELEVGVLVTGVLVTGVLVTGVLVADTLVVGAWVRARSAGSGEFKRGELEVGALGAGALLVGELASGPLAAGPLVRDLVMDGAALVGAVEFWEALVMIVSGCAAGLLITGAWLRAVTAGSGVIALGALSKEPLGMGAGKPRVRWVSAPRGSGAVTSLTGALTLVLSTGLAGGMITASRTGVAPGRDRTRRSCDRDGSLVCLSSITAEMSSRLNGFESACLAISEGIIGPWLRGCDWGWPWDWGCR